MSERRQRLRLGAFILVSLLLLAGLIILFGGIPDWFLPRNAYSIRFVDAPGIGVTPLPDLLEACTTSVELVRP